MAGGVQAPLPAVVPPAETAVIEALRSEVGRWGWAIPFIVTAAAAAAAQEPVLLPPTV